MPYKDLEHDGGEDFFVEERTRAATKEKKQKDKENQPDQEEVLSNLNERWLSPENPYLWVGEI